MTQTIYPQLERPPINEVMCGFIFEAAPVDVLDFGVYWESRRSDFPRKELHPALFDEPVLQVGGMVRAWLISENDDILIQLQHDRFYMNWRARGRSYPRFSDRHGQRGLKSRALEEWELFQRFVSERTGSPRLRLRRVEVAKIDLLEQGTHWTDHKDLGELMKVATVFRDIQLADPANLQLRLTETANNQAAIVTVTVGSKIVRIESRLVLPADENLDATLTLANGRLNDAFFGLLNREETIKRFGGAP